MAIDPLSLEPSPPVQYHLTPAAAAAGAQRADYQPTPQTLESWRLLSDEIRVGTLLRNAESIFEIAIAPAAEYDNAALVVDRAGLMRVLNSAEWSLPAIICEFGASEVYMIERRPGKVKVEGWSATDRCVVERAPS
jgi:hypothetical protein